MIGQLEQLAFGHGRTMIELALGWLASRSGIASIVVGATTPNQVWQNVDAVAAHLPEPLLAAIDACTALPTDEADGGVCST